MRTNRVSINLHNKCRSSQTAEDESGSVLIIVLAVMLLLLIIGISTLATTGSSVTLSGNYYKQSSATLASQAGISSALNSVYTAGKSGNAPFSNYPCSIPNATPGSSQSEHYQVTITYYTAPSTPESCNGSTLGMGAGTPTSIQIASTGWTGGTQNTPTNNAVTTIENVSIKDTATQIPAYAIYAGSGYYPSGQITITQAAGTTTPPNIYAGQLFESTPNTITGNPNGGSITTPGSLFINGFANLGGGYNTITGDVYANGTIYIASGSKVDGNIVSYNATPGDQDSILLDNGGTVGGNATAYQSSGIVGAGQVSGTTSQHTASSGEDLVDAAAPLPQPVPDKSTNSTPVVVVPAASCSNFFYTLGGSLATSPDGVTFTSDSSGVINTTPTEALSTITTPTVFGWNNGIVVPANMTPFQYLVTTAGTSDSLASTLTVYAPSCNVTQLSPNTYTLSANLAMFVSTILIGNGITINGAHLPTPPTLALVATATNGQISCGGTNYMVDIGFVLTACGGGTTISNIRPFFWTLGNFQTDNSTAIDGQIYAKGNVIVSNSTTIVFYPVQNGVLTFLGKPKLTPTNEYLTGS